MTVFSSRLPMGIKIRMFLESLSVSDCDNISCSVRLPLFGIGCKMFLAAYKGIHSI